jgi:hypothetical protein
MIRRAFLARAAALVGLGALVKPRLPELLQAEKTVLVWEQQDVSVQVCRPLEVMTEREYFCTPRQTPVDIRELMRRS